MKILILDDDYERHQGLAKQLIGHDLVHARDYEEAVAALIVAATTLPFEPFEQMYLDHDLTPRHTLGYYDDGVPTGADFALYVTKLPREQRPKHVVVHSWNKEHARTMWVYLKRAGISCNRVPFKEAR